jgi:hypothetical protein
MEKMMKQLGRGKMPGLPTQGAPGGSATRKPSSKRKKKKARR